MSQWLLTRLTSGNSIDVTAAIWFQAGRMPPWRTLGSAVLSIVIVGMGAPLGREGGPKQFGAVFGNLFSSLQKLSDEQRRLVVAIGAGAGMAAVYSVPLGGALFALEVLRGSVGAATGPPRARRRADRHEDGKLRRAQRAALQRSALPDLPRRVSLGHHRVAVRRLVVGGLRPRDCLGLSRSPSGWRRFIAPPLVLLVIGLLSIVFPELLGNGQAVAQLLFLHPLAPLTLQGIDEDFNITTLGRGGSDTTAVALAAVLAADACEIYTDVDGVYTTDPRLLPEARRMRSVSYDEMLELASLGAGVMHNRSIEFAKRFSVPIHVRSSFSDVTGTMITRDPEAPDVAVAGAALAKDEARVSVLGVPDKPGACLAIFSKIAAANVTVDMIVQNVGADGIADIAFTVVRDDLKTTLLAAERAARELGARSVQHSDDVAKVSVVGLGMARQTGVAQKMFRALATAGVNIHTISTSEIKISALVDRHQATAALRTVHQAFGLEQEPPGAEGYDLSTAARRKSNDALAVVSRLQKMEELTIDEISLDESQSRLTVSGVRNQPGVAATIFEEVAAAGLFVDMIVQSFGGDETANISFTVPAAQYAESVKLVSSLAKRMQCGPVTSSERVARLSIVGIGMRSHAGVAIGAFRALATAGINIEMINTSEVRLNLVVDGRQGQAALAGLRAAFAEKCR